MTPYRSGTVHVLGSWLHYLDVADIADVGGPAGHVLPEDRPGPVADALLRWVGRLP